VKLHGSVDWAKPVIKGIYDARRIPIDLKVDDSTIVVRRRANIASMRVDSDQDLREGAPPWHFYPALSVPVGSADELVCPPEHVRFLRTKLEQADATDLLLIGYSANDEEVVRLIKAAERPVRSLAIVNADTLAAQSVAEQLAKHGVVAPDHNRWIFEHAFSEFARGGELSRYLKWLADTRACWTASLAN
jgi:hypothetical protein